MLAFRLLLVACGPALAASVAVAQEGAKRVEREASNPMRLIIEAAKIRPKGPAPPSRPGVGRRRRVLRAPPRRRGPRGARRGSALGAEPARRDSGGHGRGRGRGDAPLQIRDQVEPVIPRELRSLIEGEVQVVVAFTVLPDGWPRIAEAAVLRSSHPEVNAAVLDAVRQWRYQPIAVATRTRWNWCCGRAADRPRQRCAAALRARGPCRRA